LEQQMSQHRADLNPIELYGADTGNCLRVSIALEEAGIPYVVKLMDLRNGDQRLPEHLARNPMGRVPTIVRRDRDGSTLTLSQSNAILFHICDLAPGALLPVDDVARRARVLERFFFALTDVIAPSHSAFALKQINAGDDSAERLDRRSLDALVRAEIFLRETHFIAGDDFTLADIAAFTIASAFRRQIDWAALPHMQRWFDELHARPSIANGLRAFKRY
jgi:GST-like protein